MRNFGNEQKHRLGGQPFMTPGDDQHLINKLFAVFWIADQNKTKHTSTVHVSVAAAIQTCT